MGYLKVYTREVEGISYPHELAGSIHFAFSQEGKEYIPLNQNYGILFAQANINQNNVIEPMDIKNPCIYDANDRFLIFAESIQMNGKEDREKQWILWETKDFVTFEDQIRVSYDTYKEEIKMAKTAIVVEDGLLQGIKDRWYPVFSVRTEYPKQVEVQDLNQLNELRADVIYSDGSKDSKPIKWDFANKKETQKDTYSINGTIVSKPIIFPMAVGFADPVIFQWEGFWYFLSTNDNVNDIGLFLRRANSVDALFYEDTEVHCILDYNEEKNFIQTFWAPEFHVIGGEAYILFAVGGKKWAPQSHMMKLKKGGEPIDKNSWETPIRVCGKDGKFLTEEGITLDMTYFKGRKASYLCWSYRYGIGTPMDTGSMIYIATIDEKEPWKLTSDPVLLTRPLFGWENIAGTINNEGPYPLLIGDKIYLAYSGGGACDYTYAVGYLVASIHEDLLDIKQWKKEPSPVLCSTYIEGIEGPGHNAFFQDEDGKIIVTYHAQETEKYHKRCSTMHRVHIGKNGFPFLNMSAERDLQENMKNISVVCKITK